MGNNSKELSNIQIVEIEGLWVVACKSCYDGNDERTIIGSGASREEALKDALLHSINIHDDIQTKIEESMKIFNADWDVGGLGQQVNIPGLPQEIIDLEISESFSAIAWIEEDESWGIYNR
jgi:hypothetical protein